jgi:vancomycin resistance protein VanW
MNLKNLIPKKIKLQYSVLRRLLSDFKNYSRNDFATAINTKNNFDFEIVITQEIKKTAFFENKVHNIALGGSRIEPIVILPNQIFSFWKIVKPPTQKNGFKMGRNIVNSQVSEEIGGGLCQLSSIFYFNAMQSGLEIIERYNHSVDIYKEEERFTPLGADATVVYGYKDLRIKNNYSFPIQFSFSLTQNTLTCILKSEQEITAKTLHFKRTYFENRIEVETLANDIKTEVSIYKKQQL